MESDYKPGVTKHPTELIVERIFRAIYPDAKKISVRFEVDECWYVIVDDGPTWQYLVGSDDDDFLFMRTVAVSKSMDKVESIQFPFPSDWPME